MGLEWVHALIWERVGDWGRTKTLKLARKIIVLEKKALKICLVAYALWGQLCYKLQTHE